MYSGKIFAFGEGSAYIISCTSSLVPLFNPEDLSRGSRHDHATMEEEGRSTHYSHVPFVFPSLAFPPNLVFDTANNFTTICAALQLRLYRDARNVIPKLCSWYQQFSKMNEVSHSTARTPTLGTVLTQSSSLQTS